MFEILQKTTEELSTTRTNFWNIFWNGFLERLIQEIQIYLQRKESISSHKILQFLSTSNFKLSKTTSKLKKVNASGLDVEVNTISLRFMWLKMLPFCLWLNLKRNQLQSFEEEKINNNKDNNKDEEIDIQTITKYSQKRIIIGIVGAPGAGL